MNTQTFTPQAFITLSNSGGIELMINHSGDGVSYRFNYGQDNLDKEEIFEAPITYLYGEDTESNEDANVGFYHGEDESIFYSLSEAMRINY